MEILKTVENRVHVLKAKTEDFLVANDMEQLQNKSLVNRVLDHFQSSGKANENAYIWSKSAFLKICFQLKSIENGCVWTKNGRNQDLKHGA